MKLFPSYETTFLCDCSLQEATGRIAKAAAFPANKLKIKKFRYKDGAQEIVLYSGMYEGFYHNSFAPIASLKIKEAAQGAEVSATFSLRKPVKIFSCIYCALALLLGVIVLAATLFDGRILIWAHCIPFALAAFGYVLVRAGTRFSVAWLLKELHYSLTLDFAKHLPSVHLC